MLRASHKLTMQVFYKASALNENWGWLDTIMMENLTNPSTFSWHSFYLEKTSPKSLALQKLQKKGKSLWLLKYRRHFHMLQGKRSPPKFLGEVKWYNNFLGEWKNQDLPQGKGTSHANKLSSPTLHVLVIIVAKLGILHGDVRGGSLSKMGEQSGCQRQQDKEGYDSFFIPWIHLYVNMLSFLTFTKLFTNGIMRTYDDSIVFQNDFTTHTWWKAYWILISVKYLKYFCIYKCKLGECF